MNYLFSTAYCLLPTAFSMAFIGIAINIWRDTFATGGGPFAAPAPPIGFDLLDRAGNNIKDRAGNNLQSRV